MGGARAGAPIDPPGWREGVRDPTAGLSLLLIPPGSYEWDGEGDAWVFESVGLPRRAVLLEPVHVTDGTYIPPGALGGRMVMLPKGYRFLGRAETAAWLVRFRRHREHRTFFHEGVPHPAVTRDP